MENEEVNKCLTVNDECNEEKELGHVSEVSVDKQVRLSTLGKVSLRKYHLRCDPQLVAISHTRVFQAKGIAYAKALSIQRVWCV